MVRDALASVAVDVACVAAGITVCLAVQGLLLWRSQRHDRLTLWLGLSAVALSIALLCSVLVVRNDPGATRDAAMLGRALAFSALALLALPLGASFAQHPPPPALVVATVTAVVARMGLWLGTDAVYAHRADASGTPVYGPLLLPVNIVVIGLSAGYLLRVMLGSRDPEERRCVAPAVAVSAGLLVAAMAATGTASAELLIALWPIPLVIALHAFNVRRVTLMADAERRVASRHAALASIATASLRLDSAAQLMDEVSDAARELLAADRCDTELALEPTATLEAGPEHAPTHEPPGGPRSFSLVAELQGADRPLGRIVAWRSRAFRPGDAEALAAVAQLAALALERLNATERLDHRSLHDSLTGLPNRRLLQDRLAGSLRRATRSGTLTAVILCDLDRFKDVNDRFGHVVGDALLCEISRRLDAWARAVDTVCRFGGDEFVVVCESIADEESVVALAARLQRTLDEPVVVEDLRLRVTASIGIALAGPHDNPERVMRDADTAMYHGKGAGGGRIELFNDALRAQLVRRLDLQHGLAGAAERGEILVHYQPIVDLRSGAVCRFEALARWQRNGELVGPSEWVSLAEQTGDIVAIGEAVLSQAVEQLATWTARRPNPGTPLAIAVNLSPRQLSSPSLLRTLERLPIGDLRPGVLCLEVTESAVVRDLDRAAATLRFARGLGIRVALDDFGTGYSSLNMLTRLPIDILKLDRSFMRDIEDASGRSLIAAILNLGASQGIEVVAEGVETPDQLSRLRELGCGFLQGYLLGRPSSPQSIDALDLSIADPLTTG
jgi:diguanylate cyclase (GGDEF)-like protein